LAIAKMLSDTRRRRDEENLAAHSSSIILSRTALEIYLNEIYFFFCKNGMFQENSKIMIKYSNRSIRLNYKNFVNLHILERASLINHKTFDQYEASLSLVNQIRNYCIHYTTSTQKEVLIDQLEEFEDLFENCSSSNDSPQTLVVNQFTSGWCFRKSCEYIMASESLRNDPSAIAKANVSDCEVLLKSA